MAKRRNFIPEFKAEVVLAAHRSGSSRVGDPLLFKRFDFLGKSLYFFFLVAYKLFNYLPIFRSEFPNIFSFLCVVFYAPPAYHNGQYH